MQLRIKCLLSSDIEHVLQITSIKAFPISDLSVSIIETSQNAVLLSTSQPLKEAVWQHSLLAQTQTRKCCTGHVPSSCSWCCLLALPRWHLLRGMGIAQIQPSPMHTQTHHLNSSHSQKLCPQGMAALEEPPQTRASAPSRAETGLKTGGKALGLQHDREGYQNQEQKDKR